MGINIFIVSLQSFIAFVALLAVANAAVTSHATVKHGHSDGYGHTVDHAPTHQTYKPAPVYHAAPVYHRPAYTPAPVYHAAPVYKPVYHAAPSYKPTYKEPAYTEPAVYQYQYAVADEYAGVNFGQNESRDGYSTSGEYRVVLPDCRTQVVKYNTADGYSGNVAEVTYEGTPCYPVHKAPSYHPAPAYKPAPYHA